MTDHRVVDVVDDQLGVLAGRLGVSRRRGSERYRFTYAEPFLTHPHSYDLDPALPRNGAALTVAHLFGALTDAAPDRWGRMLIDRGRTGHAFESDYLCEVHDPLRQGALRFREDGGWLNESGTGPARRPRQCVDYTFRHPRLHRTPATIGRSHAAVELSARTGNLVLFASAESTGERRCSAPPAPSHPPGYVLAPGRRSNGTGMPPRPCC